MFIFASCGIILMMKTIIIPYGKEGWEWREEYVRDIVGGRKDPPFFYRDILIIVPSARMKRTYLRLFIEASCSINAAPAIVQPDIVTLYNLIERLCHRLGLTQLIDETGRLVLLEGIVKQLSIKAEVSSLPPDILAPSLSLAVASMIEQLSSAAVTPETLRAHLSDTDYADRPATRLLIDAYLLYAETLREKGLADPQSSLFMIADIFDRSMFDGYSRIVMDGFHDATEAEFRVIEKIAALEKCTLIIESPSEELTRGASELHPLRPVKVFLERMGVATPETARTPSRDDRFISSTIFSDRPFQETTTEARAIAGSFMKKIRLLSAVNPREEVKLIAKEVKKSIRAGVQADTILVAFPSLDEYSGLVEEIFTDYGIPYNRALGRQLSTSAVTTAVISLLQSIQHDFSGPSLLRIFSSSFLKFAATPDIAPAIDNLMRRVRITGGMQKWLSATSSGAVEDQAKEVLYDALKDLFNALEPFATPDTASLDIWIERLFALMSWSKIEKRVHLVRGPLNINLQAYKKLVETLDQIKAAGRLFPENIYTFDEFLFLLKKTFMRTRFQVPPEDEAGVQVLGIMESAGRPWNEIYLGGLIDGKFPQRLSQNIFLPERVLESMGVRTIERARLTAAHHFYRLLLSAEKVTLTRPESERGQPAVASPFLAELAPIMDGGLINQGLKQTSQIQFSLRMEDSMGLTDFARSLGRYLHDRAELPPGISGVLESSMPEMAPLLSAVSSMPPKPALALPLPKKSYDVTELDVYLMCPYDYYVSYILRLVPLEEVTEDISPRERGSRVHSILREFYRRWTEPITDENMQKARTILRELAERAYKEPDTFRNAREKELFLTVMAERFLEAEKEFWKQGMRPILLEADLPHLSIRLSTGETVELHGKVDRIDVDSEGNFIVVDYKTGIYPKPVNGIEQKIFQLSLYAVMACKGPDGMSVGTGAILKRPIGLAYYYLMGKMSPIARDVVLYNKDIRDDHPVSKPEASSKTTEEFEEILKMGIEKAKTAIENILSGHFEPNPQDKNRCGYCASIEICQGES